MFFVMLMTLLILMLEKGVSFKFLMLSASLVFCCFIVRVFFLDDFFVLASTTCGSFGSCFLFG